MPWIIALIAAVLITNVGEWLIHKHALHGLGKSKSSFFHYHWEHHQRCRKNGYTDLDYEVPTTTMVSKEIGLLGALVLLLAVLWLWLPKLAACLAFTVVLYYCVHRNGHLDPEWAKKWTPWHYDHHMGRDQDKNWCVTFPWFDWVMGTREHPPPPGPSVRVHVSIDYSDYSFEVKVLDEDDDSDHS